jgi:DUF4097 and DUF4098 domain-containing protein YvlB
MLTSTWNEKRLLATVLAAALAIALGVSACSDSQPTQPAAGAQRTSTLVQRCCAIGDSSYLTVENFAGNITISYANEDTFRISATKWALSETDFDGIGVNFVERERGLTVRTQNTAGLAEAAVDIEIVAPLTLRLEASTGAGDITYVGVPRGYSRFETGEGDIDVRIPYNSNIGVQLRTESGEIDVGFAVSGLTGVHSVINGQIGTGADAYLVAITGNGNISLEPMR